MRYQGQQKILMLVLFGCVALGISGCLSQKNPYKSNKDSTNIQEIVQKIAQIEDCQNSNQESCRALLGLGVKLAISENDAKHKFGMQTIQDLCDRKLGEACFSLGEFSMYGWNLAGGDQSFPLALDSFKKACALDISLGCQYAGNMYHQGQGAQKDAKEALQYYQKDCQIALSKLKDSQQETIKEFSGWESMPCINIGKMHYRGESVPKNRKKALEYFTKGCEVSAYACSTIARQFYQGNIIDQDYKMAFRLAKLGCEKSNAESCNYLASMYLEGKGTKQDSKLAYQHFYNVCHYGGVGGRFYAPLLEKQIACYNLSLIAIQKQNHKQALQLLQQSCNEDFSKERLESNKIKIQDYTPACLYLGYAYADGYGVEQNHKQALLYFAKACDLGEQSACEAYKKMKLTPYLYSLEPNDFTKE